MSQEKSKKLYCLSEACIHFGIREEILVHCLSAKWITRSASQSDEEDAEVREFDEEDLSRARLIQELKTDFGVNDEAIPIILHLLDQVYYLRAQLSLKEHQNR